MTNGTDLDPNTSSAQSVTMYRQARQEIACESAYPWGVGAGKGEGQGRGRGRGGGEEEWDTPTFVFPSAPHVFSPKIAKIASPQAEVPSNCGINIVFFLANCLTMGGSERNGF
eukprot:Tamp_29250.p2 GENE.Tamp_29250~~Tamp_29250.p2  ORF type:complete len:113 (-),score=6.41 Tamp_29250:159-497(-)